MQKNVIIGIVVVLVLLVGAWFFFMRGNDGGLFTNTPGGATTTSGNSTSGSTTGNVKTLGAVVAQGGNYTCAITNTQDSTKTTGTIYGTAGKTRLDFIITMPTGDTVKTHVIKSGTTAYTWVDGQTVGFKSTIAAGSTAIPQPSGIAVAVSDTTNFTSDCHPWVPDQAQFSVPTNISFVAQ